MTMEIKFIVTFILLASFSINAGEVITILDRTKSEEDVSSEDMNLSDQDRYTSQNYFHEWKSYREMEEACDKLSDPDACKGNGSTKFLGIDSRIIEMVGKAFTAVVGSMDSGGGAAAQPAPAQGQDAAAGGQQQQGGGQQIPCQYIAVGTETVGTFMQTMSQQTLSAAIEGDTSHKNMLYAASNSHEQRAKTAKIQGVGYGATAGCFAINTVKSPTPGNVLKAAASGFLAAFYLTESGRQQKFADEVRDIADGLPGKGDCNPITEKACYCAQEETQEDPDYCLNYLHKNNIADASYRVACLDDEVNVDATCTCVGEESCFDKRYFTDLDFPGFSDFMSNGFGSEFKDMTNGQLKSGTLSSNSQATSAKANKLLREISKLADEQDDGSPLTKQQLADAAVAESMGIPKSVARLLAKQPVTPEVKSNIAKLQKAASKGANNYRYARKNRRSKNNVISFTGETGLDGKKSNRSGRNSYQDSKGKRKPAASNGKTMDFKMAQEAGKDADINKQPDTMIFEIISRRYKVSAWRRLDLE